MTRMKNLWPQWLAAITVTLVLIQVGSIGTWCSPYIPKLTSENSTLLLTLAEASWVASVMNLGLMMGAIVGGASVYFFGSKTSLLITCSPIVTCWILTGIANSVIWLYIARILGGVGTGMVFSSFPLYIGEIADSSIRGSLVSLALSGLPVGNLLTSIIGAHFDLQTSSMIFLALCIVTIIMLVRLPESPYGLMGLDNTEKVKASIVWYDRGCDVDKAYSSLKTYVEIANSQNFFKKMKELKKVELRKALYIVLILCMYRQMSGISSIINYMEMILKAAKSTIIPPATTVIIISAISLFAAIFSMHLTDLFGRRVLLIASSLGIAVSLIMLEIHFTLLNNGYESTKLVILPIAALISFQISAFAGIITIPSTVLSEILPPAIKCVAACTAGIVDALFAFICNKTYQPLVDTLGHEYVYWFYVIIMLSTVPFAILCMPETKGKSLQQIQDEIRVRK